MSDRIDSLQAKILADSLLDEYQLLSSRRSEFWIATVEHLMFVLEHDLKDTFALELNYRRFLADCGLSKNGYSLADGMRYLTGLDFAPEPSLFSAVVSCALQPVLERFDKEYVAHISRSKLTLRPDASLGWVKRRLQEHVLFGDTPSRFGNALMREANAMLTEKILAKSCPELFDELQLHYSDFLGSKGMQGGFVRTNWESMQTFFEIEGMFVDNWREYLSSIAKRFGIEASINSNERVLGAWLRTLGLQAE